MGRKSPKIAIQWLLCGTRQKYVGAVLVLGLFGGGCASPTVPYRTPDHWSKNNYEWPEEPSTEVHRFKGEAQEAKETNIPAPALAKSAPHRGNPAHALVPAGGACRKALAAEGVKFVQLTELRGVDNPVLVQGKLGGVEFWASDKRPFQMDCLLALALERLEPVFLKHRLTRVRYSGAYSYRNKKNGRLSQHALGLAIDIHDLTLGSESFSIRTDFARGVACVENAPALNSLACDLRREQLFQEFLTPDDNYDHRDHLHLSVPGLVHPGREK